MSQQQGRSTWLRKVEEVTQLHLLRWQCPSCGYLLEQVVRPRAISTTECHRCHRAFQIKGEQVFVGEPLSYPCTEAALLDPRSWHGPCSCQREGALPGNARQVRLDGMRHCHPSAPPPCSSLTMEAPS